MRELAVFCRKSAFLFDAGLSITEIMPVLATQSSGRALCAIIFDLHKMIMQGESFSSALRITGAFPAFMCGFIAIGERTARVPEACAKLADYYENRVQTDEELKAAMLYPVIVAVSMLGVLIMAVTFVLPGYSRIFEASDIALPTATIMLLSFSDFFATNAHFVLVGIFIYVVCNICFFRSSLGRAFSSRISLKIPISRQKTNLNIAEALSLLLSSGLGISEAVSTCGKIFDNSIVLNDLQKISSQVDSGVAFWQSLSEISYINPLLAELVRIGEETGKMPESLEKCVKYFQSTYTHNVRRLNKLIEPILTITLGAILAAIMLAIILPTFELATAI